MIRIYNSLYTYTNKFTCVIIYIYLFTYKCIYIYIYVYVCIFMYMDIRDTYMYIFICIYLNVYKAYKIDCSINVLHITRKTSPCRMTSRGALRTQMFKTYIWIEVLHNFQDPGMMSQQLVFYTPGGCFAAHIYHIFMKKIAVQFLFAEPTLIWSQLIFIFV